MLIQAVSFATWMTKYTKLGILQKLLSSAHNVFFNSTSFPKNGRKTNTCCPGKMNILSFASVGGEPLKKCSSNSVPTPLPNELVEFITPISAYCRYRFYKSSRECLMSIFRLHNETMNIWSHILGFIFFACLSIFSFNVSNLGGY